MIRAAGYSDAMKAPVVATGVIMKTFHKSSLKALAFSASALAFVIAGPAAAQEQTEEGQEEEEEHLNLSHFLIE